MQESERWAVIHNYPLYSVSTLGRVKNNKTQKILTGGLDKDGYKQLILCNNGLRANKRVHKLVALAFIENPNNKPQVNHINGIKTDNRAVNLEWATNQENQDHFWRVLNNETHRQNRSLSRKGKHLLSDNPNAKSVIRLEDGKIYKTLKEAGADINTTYNKISDVCAGRAKSVKGYHFKYLEV